MKNQKGVIVLIVFLIMGVLLILGSYFLSFSTGETKISASEGKAGQAYYLAEAGINEAIWKLKNDHSALDGDSAWADDFILPSINPAPGGGYWTSSFTHTFAGGSYTVTIQNTATARGTVVSTSSISLGNGKTSQRVIKAVVFKAIDLPVQGMGIFTGGTSENIDLNSASIYVHKGNIFANNNLNVSNGTLQVFDDASTEELEGQILAQGNYNPQGSAYIIAEAKCAKNSCTEKCAGYAPGVTACEPTAVSVPSVDFDVGGNSFKNRAQLAEDSGQCHILCNGVQCSTECVLTASQFSNLLWSTGYNGTLTLNNEITYVTGVIDLKGGFNVIVNGALLADSTVNVGMTYKWTKGGTSRSGMTSLTITQPTINSPSGLLSKNKINFGQYTQATGAINIKGVIYSMDEIRINNLYHELLVTGAIIGRKFYVSGNAFFWIDVIVDNSVLMNGLGYMIGGVITVPTYSPVVSIDHWEESY